jgi:excisionase family DNA binding protein
MEKFLKTNDAALYLGVSRSSLTNWAKQGLISGGLTPGGHYRFTVAELDRFAAERGLNIPKQRPKEQDAVRLLVIDDDPAFREFVKDALDVFSPFELREAVDGMQGALLIGTWKPHLVIVDLRMPNMNGVEFCRMLKDNPDTADVRVVIASAYLSPEAREEITELGVDVVLEKPVRLSALVATVAKLTHLELSS